MGINALLGGWCLKGFCLKFVARHTWVCMMNLIGLLGFLEVFPCHSHVLKCWTRIGSVVCKLVRMESTMQSDVVRSESGSLPIDW